MQRTPNGLEPPTETDYAFDMLEDGMAAVKNFHERVQNVIQLGQKWESIKQLASQHPVIATFTSVTLAMCSVPCLCFCAFTVATTIAMFAIFMLLEGMVLTVAIFILIGILFVVAILAFGCSFVIVIVFYLVQAIHHVISTIRPETISAHVD